MELCSGCVGGGGSDIIASLCGEEPAHVLPSLRRVSEKDSPVPMRRVEQMSALKPAGRYCGSARAAASQCPVSTVNYSLPPRPPPPDTFEPFHVCFNSFILKNLPENSPSGFQNKSTY